MMPATKPDITIIIVTYNSSDVINNCISSILKFTKNISIKIIVSDNGSTDGCIEIIKDKFPNVIINSNTDNPGYGGAVNLVMDRVDSDIIVIMNADTEFTTNILPSIKDFHEANDDVGVAGCLLKYPDGSAQRSQFRYPSLLGRIANITKINSWIHTEKKILSNGINDNGNGNSEISSASNYKIKVSVVCGAFLSVKTKVLREINLFDTDYFLYHEEADLCYRLEKSGLTNYILTNLNLIHLGTNKESSKNNLVFYHRNRSLLFYFYKHRSRLSLWGLIKINMLFFVIKYISATVIWNKTKMKSYKTVLKYHLKFIKFLTTNNKTFPN